jgi:DNA polymerase-3 subunit beta
MEFAIDRTLLLGSLSLVQGIVERRNTVPILGHVLIEAADDKLTLTATDLEVGLRTSVGCRTGSGGLVTLNARKLFEIVREAGSEEVTFNSLEGDWIELKCGRAKFKMMGLDPRSFPAMPGAGDAKSQPGGRARAKAEIKAESAVLSQMIDKTIFAVSPDEARYNLSGVYIESSGTGNARMVATDGHRLSLIEREIPGFSMTTGAIIPRKGLAEMRKLLDQPGEVVLTIDNNIASLTRGGTELSMRLVEGEFPDYKGVIPKSSRYQVAVNRDNLMAALKRASIFSNERYHGVKFSLSSATLTVSSTSPEAGEASESLDVVFNGEDFSIGFNASYLIQVLAVIDSEADVVIGLSDEVSPGVITTPSDSMFSYVVMPMRL